MHDGSPLKDQVSRSAADSLPRQYVAATAVFVLLVSAIIFLFGHLIAGSLSRQYLEDVLISGRDEARELAEEIAGSGAQEFDVFEKRQELLVKTLEGSPERKIWESIEVVDREGRVVYTSQFQATESVPVEQISHLELSGAFGDQEVVETDNSYRITVPMGEVGSVVVSVSKGRLAEKVGRLRGELLRQTAQVASVTLITLVVAFVLIWRMIQRTRRLEIERREAEELADLGVLAANLAHEIRNPLNSINLNLELLEEDLGGDAEEASASIIETRREVGRLASLVNDFLTYARPTPPSLGQISTGRLVGDVLQFLREEVRQLGVHLRASPDTEDLAITADGGQLRQVLLNLVLNAAQAVGDLPPERRVVEIGSRTVNGEAPMVELSVRDRGNGVPAEELDRVRTAFYTKRRGGTGLGLAIADRIVEAHGGRIELVNLEPSGFEARVFLPLPGGGGKMSQSSSRVG